MNYTVARNSAHLQQLLQSATTPFTILAGGTDVLVEARQKAFDEQTHLLDIGRLEAFKQIEEQENHLLIGAGVTHQQITESALVKQFAPLLSAACAQVGALQIRNRGTIGGNICNASPCADSVPPLVALGAEVTILGPAGRRQVAIEDFFEKPYQPHLKTNEVVTVLHVPKLAQKTGSAFYKLGRRNALAIARISMAAILQLDVQNQITEARLAPGSVFPVWKRVSGVETFLIGRVATEEVFTQAGQMVAAEMVQVSGRRWSTPYKEPVVAALARRVLQMAAGAAGGAK